MTPGPGIKKVFGVDFSGAQDAGNRIWMAEGTVGEGRLLIRRCSRARDLPESGPQPERCLPALRRLVTSSGDCAFGLDFPLGLPRKLVKHGRWDEFVLSFPRDYESADEFRRLCRKATGNHEPRRLADTESKAPFSPINLRIFRQTYYGIRDVLGPLVREDLVCVLPMQKRVPGKPWLMEVCPASTLKRLYFPRAVPSYKGREKRHSDARREILRKSEADGALRVEDQGLRPKILADHGGDALDSVIAALAAFRNTSDPERLAAAEHPSYTVEGYVYV